MKHRHSTPAEPEPDPESREPVLPRVSLTAATALVLAVGARFGLPINEALAEVVAAALLLAAPVVGGWWARSKAWSGATVAARESARSGGER